MYNTKKFMNSQHGEDAGKLDISPYFLKIIKKYGISREDFSLKLINKYNLVGKDRLLDIGCGDGSFCNKNINNFKKIFGIDISDYRINKSINNYPEINFSIGDMNQKLDFEDNYFDCINSLVVFDWIYDLNNALFETNRVLKNNGIFILEVSNMSYLIRRIKLLFGIYPNVSSYARSEWKKIGWDSSVCHMFTKKELKGFLEEYGFEILEISGSGFMYKFRNWWPSLLCGDLFFVCKKR